MTKTRRNDFTRHNQRLRTRRALLAAARELMKEHAEPTMEEVADRALVSRATAYRYYPNIQTMLMEAGFDAEVPAPADYFADQQDRSGTDRLKSVPDLLISVMIKDEANFRRFLAATLLDSAGKLSSGDREAFRRGGRRMGLLEKALESSGIPEDQRARIVEMAALVVGPEMFVSAVDSCHMKREAVLPAIHWLIEAIVEKASREVG